MVGDIIGMNILNVSTLNMISMAAIICAAVFIAIALFLFFRDHIKDLILTDTEYNRNKTEKRLRSAEAEGSRTPSGSLKAQSGARKHIDQFLKTPQGGLGPAPQDDLSSGHHLGKMDETSDADSKTDKLIKSAPIADGSLTTVLASADQKTQLLSEEDTDLLKADKNTDTGTKEAKIEFEIIRKIILVQDQEEQEL